MATSVTAKVTVLEVTPWAVPFTHPELLLALRLLVAAVAATDAPEGELAISTRPPNRQAASGMAITCLTRDDLRTFDTLMWFSSLWDRAARTGSIRWRLIAASPMT